MIIIRHLTGPLAGTEDRLDSKLDRIAFGRRTTCDVIYPPEETIVAREHFALVRKPPGPTGHWTIELFGEPFVAVNGIAAELGQRLSTDATFELGKHGGPSFTVIVEPDSADNMLITEPQEQNDGVRVVAARAGALAKFARRLAWVGLALAIIAGSAAVYLHSIEPFGDAVRARLLRAAFLVDAPVGSATAFPIGPFTLATNAHVGEMFEELRPDQQMIVRSPGKDGKIYKVVGAKLHPGYKALNAFLSQDVLRRNSVDIGIPGYDVATLTVEEELPADTILSLAAVGELRALNSGTALATAGYPTEGVAGGGAQTYGATPQYHTGAVTGLTDFFFLPTDFPHSQLIHDSIPAAGGASGSPIVNVSGHVVALLSAGNNYAPPGRNEPRVSSGVLINYAQRVDLLQQLLADKAEAMVAEDQGYWRKEFAVFKTGMKIMDDFIAGKIQDADKKRRINLIEISQVTKSLAKTTRFRTETKKFPRQTTIPFVAAAGYEYIFLAYAHDGSELQLFVYDGDVSRAHAGTPTDIQDHTYTPWVRYLAPNDSYLSIVVVSSKDQDVPFTFQVLKLQFDVALNQTKEK